MLKSGEYGKVTAPRARCGLPPSGKASAAGASFRPVSRSSARSASAMPASVAGARAARAAISRRFAYGSLADSPRAGACGH